MEYESITDNDEFRNASEEVQHAMWQSGVAAKGREQLAILRPFAQEICRLIAEKAEGQQFNFVDKLRLRQEESEGGVITIRTNISHGPEHNIRIELRDSHFYVMFHDEDDFDSVGTTRFYKPEDVANEIMMAAGIVQKPGAKLAPVPQEYRNGLN